MEPGGGGYVEWSEDEPVVKTARAAAFLVKAPLILVMLFVINLMTSPGHWWVQWAALGIGIAWVMSLFRVIRTVGTRRRTCRAGRLHSQDPSIGPSPQQNRHAVPVKLTCCTSCTQSFRTATWYSSVCQIHSAAEAASTASANGVGFHEFTRAKAGKAVGRLPAVRHRHAAGEVQKKIRDGGGS